MFELHKCVDINIWPKIDKKNVLDEIKLAVQINGKTRDVIKIKSDLDQNKVDQIIKNNSKATKFLINKKVKKLFLLRIKSLTILLRIMKKIYIFLILLAFFTFGKGFKVINKSN